MFRNLFNALLFHIEFFIKMEVLIILNMLNLCRKFFDFGFKFVSMLQIIPLVVEFSD